jgi:hypothetical protein
MDNRLIAPCGINCSLCLAYLRDKNTCCGCKIEGENKPLYCKENCKIKFCPEMQNNKYEYCYDCKKYPCLRIKNLDKRYRLRYKINVIENLLYIKNNGIEKFCENEKVKWSCSKCGGNICMHRGYCLKCKKEDAQNINKKD